MGSKGVALITGASGGIGATFAQRLARDGYDLILVARRREKLEKLAAELDRKYSTCCDIQVTDLACPAEVERLENYITGLEQLDLLINNAAFATIGNFADLPATGPTGQIGMAHTNLVAPVGLTHAALPGMIARHSGAIINVSSVAAYAPYPGNIMYSSTKLFLIHFTRGLNAELAGTGVVAQALCPGFTRSGIHDGEGMEAFQKLPSFLWLEADQVVDKSLKSLGGNRTVVTVGLKYQLLAAITSTPITTFNLWLIGRMKQRKR